MVLMKIKDELLISYSGSKASLKFLCDIPDATEMRFMLKFEAHLNIYL